jgi:hypothetical protein
VETLAATHIRGKCTVTLYNETESLDSYLEREVSAKNVYFNCGNGSICDLKMLVDLPIGCINILICGFFLLLLMSLVKLGYLWLHIFLA